MGRDDSAVTGRRLGLAAAECENYCRSRDGGTKEFWGGTPVACHLEGDGTGVPFGVPVGHTNYIWKR